MPKTPKRPKAPLQVEALTHQEAKRRNIPTAEHESVVEKTMEAAKAVRYPRNTDLDPQLVWRGKDEQDWTDLVVQAPPIYIQEKIHPKTLIDDLMRQSKSSSAQQSGSQIDLFSDFNGIPEGAEKTEFYQHDQNWSNRMILGDSLQVMASLAEREGLRGKVQCIYFDPPYGIKFNSNFQWSTTSRDVKDGNAAHITREPEQVKAFRDTWRDGIHSYLTYLRDRLTVARDLLTESGSIFVQIGDENVHRVREVMDEVFGDANFIQLIPFRKKLMPLGAKTLEGMTDYLLFYAKDLESVKYRPLYKEAQPRAESRWTARQNPDGSRERLSAKAVSSVEDPQRVYRLVSQRAPSYSEQNVYSYSFRGRSFDAPGSWVTTKEKMRRLELANRLEIEGGSLSYVYFFGDFPYQKLNNLWDDTAPAQDKTYVVQTNPEVVQRCLLMTTDPGDLVLDPTCGSGTTCYVAERWGRRWITVDTSRVALALARSRLVGAKYPFYLLVDSPEGQRRSSEEEGRAFVAKPTGGSIRHGFVYVRVPHISLKSIVNDSEIDVIWENRRAQVSSLLEQVNEAVGQRWREWEVPTVAEEAWSAKAVELHGRWVQAQAARQKDIDASIASKAEFEYLYDRAYDDPRRVRVAGPFTVESLSPHRTLGVDADGELVDPLGGPKDGVSEGVTFGQMILDNLKTAGVQQAHKGDRITFASVAAWPGELVSGEGRYRDGGSEKRAAIFIGPEFGTVGRADLVKAAREAGDAGFDVLIACAFNYEAHAAEFSKLGRIPVLKARMNADLHMAGDLKATDKANLFVIFGEPDIEIHHQSDGQIFVQVKGVDVFDPSTGEVRSDSADGIACWFIDTDYNEESFFVRHAYFLGQNDPYSSLRTTLKAEINADAWATLHSDTSRPFPKPTSGRIAVKVINHLGDEVMKVFRVE